MLIPAVALGAADYVSVRALALEHGLDYKDLSRGTMHACKLTGNGRDVLLFADLRNIVVSGSTIQLQEPVGWDGSSITVPAGAAEVILRGFGQPRLRPRKRPRPGVRPLRGRFKVVIDPGHGGRDPGAVYGGLREKDVNLDVARRLAAYLESDGVGVVMTRRRDVYVSLNDRVAIANRQRPDLFLSIHANAEVSRKQHGAMSLYPDDGTRDGRPGILGRARREAGRGSGALRHYGAGGPVGKAAALAVTMAAFESNRVRSIQAARKIQESLAPVTGCVRRANGIIEDFRGLRVLRGVKAPTVLVEVDFLSNPKSRRKLARASYREAIARAIRKAVIRFLRDSAPAEEAS